MSDKDRILGWIMDFESTWTSEEAADTHEAEYIFHMEQLIDRIKELLLNG